MPYDPNKPGPNDLLSNSQLDIQSNFETANTVMDKNHYPFDNTSGNQGKHKFVEMPVGSLPIGLSASESTVYGKTANGASQLFYTNGSSGNEYQMTRANDLRFASFATNLNYLPNGNPAVPNQDGGWTFLPGGLLLQYGTMKSTGNTTAVTFPIQFTTAVYSLVGFRNQQTTTGNGYGGITTSGFNFESSSSQVGIEFRWIAIGF